MPVKWKDKRKVVAKTKAVDHEEEGSRPTRDALVHAMALVCEVAEQSARMPVLANVALVARGGRLLAEATDLDRWLRVDLGGSPPGFGAITVNARRLRDIMKRMPAGPLGLESGKDALVVTPPRSRFELQGASHEEFPEMPAALGGGALAGVVRSGDWMRAIDAVEYAVCRDDTRYNLNLVHVEDDGDGLLLVATDGYRMAVAPLSMRGSIGSVVSADEKPGARPIRGIPCSALDVLARMAKGAEELWVGFSPEHFVARAGAATFAARLVEGEFPARRQVWPRKWSHEVALGTEGFLEALARVAVFANDRTHATRLVVDAGGVVLSASNPDVGSAEESVPCAYAGPRVESGFNAASLRQCVAKSVGEAGEFTLRFNEGTSPISIHGPCADVLLMPMRM